MRSWLFCAAVLLFGHSVIGCAGSGLDVKPDGGADQAQSDIEEPAAFDQAKYDGGESADNGQWSSESGESGAGDESGDGSGSCRGPGRYEVGKGDIYLPCCDGLSEVLYEKAAWSGNEMDVKVCDSPPLRVYACVQGTCGDGICEIGESEPCGCVADCPSAAWGEVPTGEVR
jgi:hypothetical protein